MPLGIIKIKDAEGVVYSIPAIKGDKGDPVGADIVGLLKGTGTAVVPAVKADITALGIPAQDTVYTHPAEHAISVITGLQTALNNKVDDSQVLTDVPAGALFTDTVYSHPNTDGNLHVPATGTTNSGKVLTAGATAGSFSWVTLPLLINGSSYTARTVVEWNSTTGVCSFTLPTGTFVYARIIGGLEFTMYDPGVGSTMPVSTECALTRGVTQRIDSTTAHYTILISDTTIAMDWKDTNFRTLTQGKVQVEIYTI